MKGGKLSVKEIKLFLQASYDVNDKEKFINGYQMDVGLSNKWGKVFVSQELRKVIIAHRGTRSAKDWRNNATIGLGVYQLTDRFKTGKLLQEQAEYKYRGYKFYTLGHSQAGKLVQLLGQNTTGISVNPAYLLENQRSNEFTIRSSHDPVSGVTKTTQGTVLNVTNPKFNRRNNIIVPSKSYNPLSNHSLDMLDNLDENMMIGRGKQKFKININELLKNMKK